MLLLLLLIAVREPVRARSTFTSIVGVGPGLADVAFARCTLLRECYIGSDSVESPEPRVNCRCTVDVVVVRAMHELHAAAAAGDVAKIRELLDAGDVAAHVQEDTEGTSALMHAAAGGHGAVIDVLLEYGAPWNAIDRRGRCAGNYALDAGHQEVVDKLVEFGTRAELLLGAAARCEHRAAAAVSESMEYLARSIRYEGDVLFDEADDAVMMEWETPLMEAHADRLCAAGGDVLNVGFGMGIIDGLIAARSPRSHTIIEAHPGVLERINREGWPQRAGVRVLSGRWQDVLPPLLAEGIRFDGIFYDTYGRPGACLPCDTLALHRLVDVPWPAYVALYAHCHLFRPASSPRQASTIRTWPHSTRCFRSCCARAASTPSSTANKAQPSHPSTMPPTLPRALSSLSSRGASSPRALPTCPLRQGRHRLRCLATCLASPRALPRHVTCLAT